MYTLHDVRKVQIRLLEMAVAIRDILESYNIPYFITYGTLLGAVRHGGFIPWDDDFDFYLFDDTYEKAMDILKKHLPLDMFLEYSDSEPLYFHGWSHVKDMNTIAKCDKFPQDNCYEHKGICVDLYRTKRIPEEEERLYRVNEEKKYLFRRKRVGLIDEEVFSSRIATVEKNLKEELSRLKQSRKSGNDIFAFSIFYDDRLYPDELFPLKKYRFENTEFLGPNNASALLSRCYGDYMQLPSMENRKPHYSSVTFL